MRPQPDASQPGSTPASMGVVRLQIWRPPSCRAAASSRTLCFVRTRAQAVGDRYRAPWGAGPGDLKLETVGALALIGAVGFGSAAFAAVAALFVAAGAQRNSG